jgi:ABC-2 type transport system permease protein
MTVLSPAPGRAPLPRMLRAQTLMELRLTLRRGESLLLTLVIPMLLLVMFSTVAIVNVPKPRVAFLVPGILALAVMSTAFTGQAIATGYERHYGVLKRLGATALPRWVLLSAKTAAVFAVEVLQVALVVAAGFALGWAPSSGAALPVAGLLLVGTAAFSGLGLLMAGTLRAELTLALANFVYLILLVVGGVVFPTGSLPGGLPQAVRWLPLDALADGLRGALRSGGPVAGHDWLVLALWAAASGLAAAASFRWE